MKVTGAHFDDQLDTWLAEHQQPWTQLSYDVLHANLEAHLAPAPLRILDAGGGDGRTARFLAALGHRVTVVDFSNAMLTAGRRAAVAAGLVGTVTFVQGDVATIGSLFLPDSFHVALCHNVLQYITDAEATLAALGRLLVPGGLLSLVTINCYSDVYKAAFRAHDLEAARAQLDAPPLAPTFLGMPARRFSPAEMEALIAAAGCRVVGCYGIRCLCDWLPNEPKHDPAYLARLTELERAMSGRYPYYLLARSLHMLGRVSATVSSQTLPGTHIPR